MAPFTGPCSGLARQRAGLAGPGAWENLCPSLHAPSLGQLLRGTARLQVSSLGEWGVSLPFRAASLGDVDLPTGVRWPAAGGSLFYSANHDRPLTIPLLARPGHTRGRDFAPVAETYIHAHTRMSMLQNVARRSALAMKAAPVRRVAARSFAATTDYVEPAPEYTKDGALIVENVSFTLEWVLSSPPPLHAFEEPPIMCEWPEGEAGGH
mmetsp:Transcript_9122/g.25980  ORF Transcript_9122/g.25980 Transcript_9122/m.25980 type:complete len:209 (+) Transcript_9122:204-830(+)